MSTFLARLTFPSGLGSSSSRGRHVQRSGFYVSLRSSIIVLALASFLGFSVAPVSADTTVAAQLGESNHSGVTGTATLTATDDGGLRVVIHAKGHVPSVPHAQHIHGSASGGHHMCASMADDADGDGLLTNEEASGEYG